MAPRLRWLRLSPPQGPALPETPHPRQRSRVSLLRGSRLTLSGGLHQAREALARQRFSLEGGTDRQKRPGGVSDAMGWRVWLRVRGRSLPPVWGTGLPTLALPTGRQGTGGEGSHHHFGCLRFCPRQVVRQGGAVASDVQVAITQGGQWCPGTPSHEDISFLCYMGTGQSKSLSYAHLQGCKTKAAMKAGMPFLQPVIQYHLHITHGKQI